MKFLANTKFFVALSVIIFFVITDVVAQKKESKNKDKPKVEDDNSFAPFKQDSDFGIDNYTQSKKSAKKAKKSRKARKAQRRTDSYDFMKSLDKKKEEFYKRIKRNAKEDKKLARKMKKPQYADPLYFGHKKKPKKRPVGKRKLCKECGIVH